MALLAPGTSRSSKIHDSLTRTWRDAVHDRDVSGQLSFGRTIGLDPAKPTDDTPYVELPRLGKVYGSVRLYDRSLETGRQADQGRSSGFFVMVRGRLINPTDDKLFLNEPSFGTFYRSQYVLNVNGLDEDLLADRERLRQGTPRAEEMRVLQRAVYLVTRTAQTERDEDQANEESTGGRLPTQSREYFREPLAALIAKAKPELASKFDMANPQVHHASLGTNGPMAGLAADGGGFVINVEHPYYRSLEGAVGNVRTSAAKEFMRRYELIAIGGCLLEGQLYEFGMPPALIPEIVRWLDGWFRTMARASHASLYKLGEELTSASYRPGKPFEKAIAAILTFMGLNAKDDGASGQKDGVLEAPLGPDTYTLTFEAKGSKSSVANDQAEVGAAAAHRDAVGADHAIIVAREFAGFERPRGELSLRFFKSAGRQMAYP